MRKCYLYKNVLFCNFLATKFEDIFQKYTQTVFTYYHIASRLLNSINQERFFPHISFCCSQGSRQNFFFSLREKEKSLVFGRHRPETHFFAWQFQLKKEKQKSKKPTFLGHRFGHRFGQHLVQNLVNLSLESAQESASWTSTNSKWLNSGQNSNPGAWILRELNQFSSR